MMTAVRIAFGFVVASIVYATIRGIGDWLGYNPSLGEAITVTLAVGFGAVACNVAIGWRT